MTLVLKSIGNLGENEIGELYSPRKIIPLNLLRTNYTLRNPGLKEITDISSMSLQATYHIRFRDQRLTPYTRIPQRGYRVLRVAIIMPKVVFQLPFHF